MNETFSSFLSKLFNLREGAEDKEVIIENIKNDVGFSSARLWTLICAISLASIGLNVNSIPIVIGAMLISPLMGPIVGVGLSLAISDHRLLHRAMRSVLVLTVISIVVSSIYFWITPITNAQSELLARTQPTIFDVLIAFFGGLAGFIGLSRSRQSTVVPGVAIATALMPPLCTVGYGIATLQPRFIFGALYLFVINSIFICLATLFISKYLKLPRVHYEDEARQKRVRSFITALIVIIVLPAIYLAYTFVQENNFKQNVDRYIQTVFEDRGYVIIHEKVTFTPKVHAIELAFLSERFSDEQITEFKDRLTDFKLSGTDLIIKQDTFSLTEKEWRDILASVQSDDEQVKTLEARLAREEADFTSAPRLLEEAKVIDNRIVNLAVGPIAYATGEHETASVVPQVVILYMQKDAPPVTDFDRDQLTSWLAARLENPMIELVVFEPKRTVIPLPEVQGVATGTLDTPSEE